MNLRVSRTFVRCAAIFTALACSLCLYLLASEICWQVSHAHPAKNNFILLLILLSVLPLLFIWECIRVWRYVPKAIESLSVIWAFSGVLVFFCGVHFWFQGWKVRGIIFGVIGLGVILCGWWITRQQGKLEAVRHRTTNIQCGS